MCLTHSTPIGYLFPSKSRCCAQCRIADRAFKLSKHAAQLEAHSKKSFSEKGVQADAGAVAGQNYSELGPYRRGSSVQKWFLGS
jgi:hypothetical protein